MNTKTLLLAAALLCPAAALYAQRGPANPKMTALMGQKDSTALNRQLDSLLKTNQEEDLTLLIGYYNAKQNGPKREEIEKLSASKYPNGLGAFDQALNKIYTETDGAVNEKNYNDLMARFSKNPKLAGHKFFDFSRYYTAVSFRNNPKKVMEYLSLIQDTVYKTQAFSYASREAYGRKEYVLAEQLIRQSLNDLAKRKDESSAAYFTYLKQYASALNANQKYAEGLKYARIVQAKGDQKDKAFADTYMNLLVGTGEYQEAFPMMEESVREGRASELVKAKLKDAYKAVKGSDKDFAVFEASLQSSLKESIKAGLLKKMISEPAFNFTVKDLNGKLVSLADYKGKTVILDFWATWCGPCKASFPHMQAAVNKFKNDPSVVFLFIHTWETDANPVKSAGDYVKNNKYTFNVLIDLKDPVTKSNSAAVGYKLKGIPAKFVIDGQGNIRFNSMGNSAAGDDAFVEEMSTMIQLAKTPASLGK
ncbi:TlpA family protein disulfide reductase [Pedobacter sp. GR22-6]|uniref:TlpA family protein disulfide reductase n=1 Tax=Pedobacter sp. GR22-6 TaxID=3127957 RepID=UPI00307E5C27